MIVISMALFSERETSWLILPYPRSEKQLMYQWKWRDLSEKWWPAPVMITVLAPANQWPARYPGKSVTMTVTEAWPALVVCVCVRSVCDIHNRRSYYLMCDNNPPDNPRYLLIDYLSWRREAWPVCSVARPSAIPHIWPLPIPWSWPPDSMTSEALCVAPLFILHPYSYLPQTK